MSCTQCLRFQKRIKVMVSDHQFQLRKLSEDKAQDKVMYQLNVQKELRKWQQKYNKQKQDHEENHKKWLNKIDETIATSQFKISQHKKLSHETMHSQRMSAKQNFQLEINRLLTHHQHEIKQLNKSHQTQLENIQKVYKNQISTMEKKYHEQTQKRKSQSNQKEQFLKRQYQSIILGLRSQKSAEQKQNIRLQQQHRKQRSKYLGQIYDNKITVASFQQKTKELKEIIAAKQLQIKIKKQQILQLLQKHKTEMTDAQYQRQKAKKQWEQCLQNQLKVFYERQLEITELYENTVKTIQEKRQNQQKLYQSNLQEVRACIDNRPSRIQDVEEILILRERLSRKQRQYQSLQRQVKNYQLQLQNKQDTYNKMFIPSVNSAHLNEVSTNKRKELKIKRPGKSVSTVRDILNAIGIPSNNLPLLNSIDKKLLPPRSTKIL